MINTRIALSLILPLTLGGCSTLFFDYSRLESGDRFLQYFPVNEVSPGMKEPTRLSAVTNALERVELKKNPGSESCPGFANWLPSELVKVTQKMDLRLLGFGKLGRGLVVKHPSGKIECGKFAEGNDPAEILLLNATPGIYEVRISAPTMSTRLADFDNLKRSPENENRLYTGEFMQIFAEDVSDKKPATYPAHSLAELHASIREKARLANNQYFDDAVARGRAALAKDAKERSEFFSTAAAVSVQALQEVAQEQQANALATQAARDNRLLLQAQQQAVPPVKTQGAQPSRNPSSANSIQQQSALGVNKTVPNAKTVAPASAPKKVSYPASILEFDNPLGWKRGASSGEQVAGDLSIGFVTKAVAIKGKMSVLTRFCNNDTSPWRGGYRISPNPPSRSHASIEIASGSCVNREETFSEGAATIYVYTKRAE